MFRLLAIPAVLVLLLAGAMYLSGGTARQKADFTFTTDEEIHTLDTQRMSWSQDFRVAYGLWEGLYRLDPKTLVAIPGAADRIDISPDKTVYTFHIRSDARWSNGDPVVAHDFVFAWRRLLEEPGEYTYLFHYIVGAQDYEEAFEKESTTKKYGVADFKTVGIKETDRLTLVVTLIHPVVPFPDICAMPPFFPQNERAMQPFLEKDSDAYKESGGRILRFDKQFTLPPNLVTNGPYYLESWVYKSRMRLRANPYYWRKSEIVSPVIDQIVAKDAQWGYAMFDSGGADWIPDFTGEIAAELHARHEPNVHVFPAFGTYFYSFNCLDKFNDGSKNPLSDKRIRQALTMAVDKKVIVETITRMGEIPTSTYIPANSFKGYQTPRGLPYDIAAAKKLMADAGYPNGKGFPAMSILYNDVAPHAQIAETISRQWHTNLGIEVQPMGIEGKTFADRQHNHDYSICRASWYGDYLDPSTFTDKYKPDSENNEAGWKNDDYSKWCAKADVEPDPAKRLEYYAKAETILLDEAPILPIYTYVETYLMRGNVEGIPMNSRTMLVLSSAGVRH